MSQSSNAQREPSMEEILSSIRKIIEDGEPAQSPELLNAATKSDPVEEPKPVAVEPVVAEPAMIDSTAPEIEEFRRELTGASHPIADVDASEADEVKQEDPSPAAALDLEEESPVEFTAPDIVDEKPVLEAARAEFEQEPALQEDDDEIDQDVFPAETKQRLSAEPIAATPVSEDDETGIPDPMPAEEATSEQPEPQVPEIQAARPIISEVAGRKIAASFEQLSEAFAETRKKSFDEMAEEMLRPMLQEWLDNNLPLLVERLVREEIERVARGEVA